MKGPRSIAESTNSTQYRRFSTSASISALSLDTSYAGLKSGKVLVQPPKNAQSRPKYYHDMVERYERMRTLPDSGSFYPDRIPQTSHNKQDLTSELEAIGKKEKNRSPLRQSIKNLLSAIKGTAKSSEASGGACSRHDTGPDLICPPRGPQKDSPTTGLRRGTPRNVPAMRPSEEHPPHSLPVRASEISTTVSLDSHADFSGPIWHFSRNSTPPAAWNLCTGVIKDRRLYITSFATQRVVEVDLSRCTDVRPVVNDELDEDEFVSLSRSDETRELKVLELFLPTKSQKLAVRNLGERAAWIDVLWDSIMPNFGKRTSEPRKDSIQTPTPCEGRSSDANISIPQVLVPDAALAQAMKQRERSLPPLPPRTPKILPPLKIPPISLISNVDIMPRIDSARTPSPSIYSPGSPSQLGRRLPITSPSIADLGRRSMVKQRLAEMQKLSEDELLESPCPKRTSDITSAFSPAGTGRSGFLSVLMSDDEPESNVTSFEEHTPFEHLRESKLIREAKSDKRPAFERAESCRSELPYVNGDGQENDQVIKQCLAECLKPIADDLVVIKSQLGGAAEQPMLRQVLLGIDDCSRSTKRTVEELVRKFESLAHERARSFAKSSGVGLDASPIEPSYSETREVLETTRTDLFKKMDVLMERFEGMQCIPRESTKSDGPCPLTLPAPSLAITKADFGTLKEDISGALISHITSLCDNIPITTTSANISDELSRMGALIQNDNAQRTLQVQQQADSVRYLNELNSWLETFVSNGTAQINGIATNVEQLCRHLGSSPDLPRGGILNDIYAMLSELRNRADTSFLQQSVERLTKTIKTSSQNATDMQALVSFMECQRREQETFLRAFAAEISGEIKGERLRFVEAMKEATAINVQMQVDSLKKELAHQVVVMAQDLGRLETEKRAVETKIANLHAFHVNQKQNLGQPAPLTVTANRPTYRPLTRQPAYAAFQQSRSLPYPR